MKTCLIWKALKSPPVALKTARSKSLNMILVSEPGFAWAIYMVCSNSSNEKNFLANLSLIVMKFLVGSVSSTSFFTCLSTLSDLFITELSPTDPADKYSFASKLGY
jgi:hypothetical protein